MVSCKFFGFPQHPSRPPQAAVQCCHLLLTSPVISPLFLMKKWQVRVISLGMWPTTVKLIFQMNSQGIYTCGVCHPLCKTSQTAYQLKDSICTCTHDGCTHCISQGWLLGVVVVLSPSAVFTFTEMSWQALIVVFIGCSWQALMHRTHWSRLLLITLDGHWWTCTL